MMAPFMQNSRRNGLLFPEGYWAQHRPEQLLPEDYLAARWIAKPANLLTTTSRSWFPPLTCLRPPTGRRTRSKSPFTSSTTPRAGARPGASHPTLEEVQAETGSTGRKIYEGAGITAADLSFENMYDGFAEFHQFHVEAWATGG